jgi:hypothetical protein
MFVVYGVTIAWAAISNLLSLQVEWLLFSLFQIILAVSLFRRFFSYRKVEEKPIQSASVFTSQTTDRSLKSQKVFPITGCFLGVLSIGGFIVSVLAMMFYPLEAGNDQITLLLEFGAELMVNIGVLGVAISLASLLSKYSPRYLTIGGLVSGAITLLAFLGLILLL